MTRANDAKQTEKVGEMSLSVFVLLKTDQTGTLQCTALLYFARSLHLIW